MTNLELFIKENRINILKMESDLGLPNRSIQLSRGIPKKHISLIKDYLRENYGFESDIVEVDEPDKPVVKKMYNEGRIPEWQDKIARFRDPGNGLWRRFRDWCESVDAKTGEVKVRSGFEKVSEDFEDEIGRYYLCKNGIKVYYFD